MTDQDQEAIRWALAEDLKGMREACPVVWETTYPAGGLISVTQSMAHRDGCTANPCRGYVPIPLANGEIDEGRLRLAIEAAGRYVQYNSMSANKRNWVVGYSRRGHSWGHDPSLPVAYLKARGKWPVK